MNMKMTREKLRKFAIESLMGFILWVIILTPYSLIVTQLTMYQYLTWILMEIMLVLPFASPVVKITNWAVKRLSR